MRVYAGHYPTVERYIGTRWNPTDRPRPDLAESLV